MTQPTPENALDAELLDRFVESDDQTAFAQLVKRHGPLVLGVCRRVLRNLHDAEDAFQSTFIILARQAQRIRQHRALPAWLYRVAYHLSVKLRNRVEKRREFDWTPVPSSELSAEHRLHWQDLGKTLDEELQRLPEKFRSPLLLCSVSGLSRSDAARQLGWTLGALKMRLERGRQLLRKRLARRGVTLSSMTLGEVLHEEPLPEGLNHRVCQLTERLSPNRMEQSP